MQELWTEKYRPDTLDGYVFRDESQKEQVTKWINDKSIPNCLFSGAPGTGKSTLARILINSLDLIKHDVLEINASRENGIDFIRDKISTFAGTLPFGDFKIIFLDEADFLSANAQAGLRGLMESYHKTVRFIYTANYPHKIIPALHSRCQGFHIEKLDITEFTTRVAEVLLTEEVQFDLPLLDEYINTVYPDLRKCLNLCQMNSGSGVLVPLSNGETGSATYDDVVALFKAGNIQEARTTLCQNIQPDEVDGIIRWAYDHLSLWGETSEDKDYAIKIIRNAAVNASFVADPEINISAMFVELTEPKE